MIAYTKDDLVNFLADNGRLEDALRIYADPKHWTEYSLSLKRHWYWTDGTEGRHIAAQALSKHNEGNTLRMLPLLRAASDLLQACKYNVQDLAIGTEGYSMMKAAIQKAESEGRYET